MRSTIPILREPPELLMKGQYQFSEKSSGGGGKRSGGGGERVAPLRNFDVFVLKSDKTERK